MSASVVVRRVSCTALAVASLLSFGSVRAADLDPKALLFTLPDKIKWSTESNGAQQAVLAGDPSKPGLYVVLTKWTANHGSRPHSHPNNRYIYVIKGTWWVGTGTKYEPESRVPIPAGSFVTHFGGQAHYDGAKEEETILEIVGEGPGTSTIREVK
jgi:quercetin dioxygenase-like cupin family protein